MPVYPDEKLLIFTTMGRVDGLGEADLYYSTKDHESGTWEPAKNMGDKINTKSIVPIIHPTCNTFSLVLNLMSNGFPLKNYLKTGRGFRPRDFFRK